MPAYLDFKSCFAQSDSCWDTPNTTSSYDSSWHHSLIRRRWRTSVSTKCKWEGQSTGMHMMSGSVINYRFCDFNVQCDKCNGFMGLRESISSLVSHSHTLAPARVLLRTWDKSIPGWMHWWYHGIETVKMGPSVPLLWATVRWDYGHLS